MTSSSIHLMASSIFRNSLIRNLQNVDISHNPNFFIFFFLRKTYIASLSAIYFYESGSCFRVLSIDSIPAVPFLNKRAAKPNLF